MNRDFKSLERKITTTSEKSSEQYSYIPHNGIECPNCKQVIDRNYELCPKCGYRLHSNHCTFCGAPMDSDDLFCGECGGSAKGIKCPTCGTLSFRSFCPKCNQPVDKLGEEELQRAKNDPLYQRACALAEKIVKAQEKGQLPSTDENALSPQVIELLKYYQHLKMSSNSSVEKENAKEKEESVNNDVKIEQEHQNISVESKAIKLSDSDDAIDDISSYIDELNDLLKSMVPPPGEPPQIQRNYYSARKVAVFHKSKVKEKVGWVCNLCGYCHESPSECARPELGGTWVYREKEITIMTYE